MKKTFTSLIACMLLIVSISMIFNNVIGIVPERDDTGINGGNNLLGVSLGFNGPYRIGKWDTDFTGPYGETVPVHVYYPADTNGTEVPVNMTEGPYPGLSFGHGFQMSPADDYYDSYGEHYASWGYIVAMPDYQYAGLFNSDHAKCANESLAAIDFLQAQNTTVGSLLEGAIDEDLMGATGHSLGAKCSILAVENEAGDPSRSDIKAVAPMALANDRTPSTFPRADRIEIPVQLQAATNDGVAPPEDNSQLLYDYLVDVPAQFVNISGGNHNQYGDQDPPSGGMGDGDATISRDEQHRIACKYATAFFNYYLKGQEEYYTYLYGAEAQNDVNSGVLDSNQFKNAAKPVSIELEQGWNFISKNVVTKGNEIDALLNDMDKGISGNYDKVMYYQPPQKENLGQVDFWQDDFESENGWTFSGGEWERDVPQGLGGSDGNPDPGSAYEGTCVLGYDLTSDGDYESSISTTHWATSPIIDCAGKDGISLSFQRWLGVESSSYDHAYIEVYDGGAWQQIWSNGGSMSDGAWNYIQYDVSQYADNNPSFQIRFGLGTTDGSVEYCGWNVDDVKLSYESYEWTEGNWRIYAPGRADHFNSLRSWDETMGIWIHMTSSDVLEMSGTVPSAASITLSPGWNMVGYMGDDNVSADSSLPAEVTKMGTFDETQEYNVHYTADLSSVTLYQQHGYWVYNDADQTVDWTQ
ncbi:MAG: hypothetical protein R6U61_02425 [Thermoplasmata archaeon]